MSKKKPERRLSGAYSRLGPRRMRTAQLSLASSILACLGPARAQQTASGSLEEIVVTAQKRTESLQDVPLSITALDTAQLEQMNAQTVDDYIKYLPSVSYTTTG